MAQPAAACTRSGLFFLAGNVEEGKRDDEKAPPAAGSRREVPPAPQTYAHKIGPGVQNGLKEKIDGLLRYVGWQRVVIDVRCKVIRLIRGEHDQGHQRLPSFYKVLGL